MDATQIRRTIMRIAHEIVERNKGVENVILVGIRKRGVPLAERIARAIEKFEGVTIPVGALDITLYRDDLQLVSETPIIESTDIPFDITKKAIVLVDDVLYTGRTIRAAMEELFNFGRPKAIQLAVLVDRGLRELPIQADFIGKYIPTAKGEIVDVHIQEIDNEDCVLIQGASTVKGKSKKKPKAKKRKARKRS